MMPTLGVKDNVIQAVAVVAGGLVGAAVGYVVNPRQPAVLAVGAVVGIVAAALVSGMVLMVLGWVRASRSKRRPPGAR